MSLWNSIMGMIKEKRIKMEKAMQVFEAKEEYFIHNGAILLEKQISCNQGRDIETIGVFLPRKSNKLQINMILI